jgi:sucrose-6F-phosphate phosphohydrolase
MTGTLLLCTDLDRTLIPNGPEPESSGARDCFQQLCRLQSVKLAFVSGRDRSLVEQAILKYELPIPDYVIADVGTTIYEVSAERSWHRNADWEEENHFYWNGYSRQDLQRLFSSGHNLRLQEENKQGRYKLSFYIDLSQNRLRLLEQMQRKLDEVGVRANLVWSVDEAQGVGLLDLLPQGASKSTAIDFLRRQLAIDVEDTFFSGDSGNDLDVIASPIPSVLVANAQPEVKAEARRLVTEKGTEKVFYQATGGYRGMNGCYSAGILEGVAHYHPQLCAQLEKLC